LEFEPCCDNKVYVFQLEIDFEAMDATDLESETRTIESDEFVVKDTSTKRFEGALLFSSKTTAHALFDFLLNWTHPRLEMRCSRTPTLISSKPFLGARLQQATVTRSTVKSKDSKSNLYKICVAGRIIPTKMLSLLEIVRLQQTKLEETDCLVVFETDEQTIIKELDTYKSIEFKNRDIISTKI
jgi:hypothetical protein